MFGVWCLGVWCRSFIVIWCWAAGQGGTNQNRTAAAGSPRAEGQGSQGRLGVPAGPLQGRVPQPGQQLQQHPHATAWLVSQPPPQPLYCGGQEDMVWAPPRRRTRPPPCSTGPPSAPPAPAGGGGVDGWQVADGEHSPRGPLPCSFPLILQQFLLNVDLSGCWCAAKQPEAAKKNRRPSAHRQ